DISQTQREHDAAAVTWVRRRHGAPRVPAGLRRNGERLALLCLHLRQGQSGQLGGGIRAGAVLMADEAAERAVGVDVLDVVRTEEVVAVGRLPATAITRTRSQPEPHRTGR